MSLQDDDPINKPARPRSVPPTSPLDLELVELFKRVKAIRDRRRNEGNNDLSTPAPPPAPRPWPIPSPRLVALVEEAVRLRLQDEAEERAERNATGSPPAGLNGDHK